MPRKEKHPRGMHLAVKIVEGKRTIPLCGRKKVRGFMDLDVYQQLIKDERTDILSSVCLSCKPIGDELLGRKPKTTKSVPAGQTELPI